MRRLLLLLLLFLAVHAQYNHIFVPPPGVGGQFTTFAPAPPGMDTFVLGCGSVYGTIGARTDPYRGNSDAWIAGISAQGEVLFSVPLPNTNQDDYVTDFRYITSTRYSAIVRHDPLAGRQSVDSNTLSTYTFVSVQLNHDPQFPGVLSTNQVALTPGLDYVTVLETNTGQAQVATTIANVAPPFGLPSYGESDIYLAAYVTDTSGTNLERSILGTPGRDMALGAVLDNTAHTLMVAGTSNGNFPCSTCNTINENQLWVAWFTTVVDDVHTLSSPEHVVTVNQTYFGGSQRGASPFRPSAVAISAPRNAVFFVGPSDLDSGTGVGVLRVDKSHQTPVWFVTVPLPIAVVSEALVDESTNLVWISGRWSNRGLEWKSFVAAFHTETGAIVRAPFSTSSWDSVWVTAMTVFDGYPLVAGSFNNVMNFNGTTLSPGVPALETSNLAIDYYSTNAYAVADTINTASLRVNDDGTYKYRGQPTYIIHTNFSTHHAELVRRVPDALLQDNTVLLAVSNGGRSVVVTSARAPFLYDVLDNDRTIKYDDSISLTIHNTAFLGSPDQQGFLLATTRQHNVTTYQTECLYLNSSLHVTHRATLGYTMADVVMAMAVDHTTNTTVVVLPSLSLQRLDPYGALMGPRSPARGARAFVAPGDFDSLDPVLAVDAHANLTAVLQQGQVHAFNDAFAPLWSAGVPAESAGLALDAVGTVWVVGRSGTKQDFGVINNVASFVMRIDRKSGAVSSSRLFQSASITHMAFHSSGLPTLALNQGISDNNMVAVPNLVYMGCLPGYGMVGEYGSAPLGVCLPCSAGLYQNDTGTLEKSVFCQQCVRGTMNSGVTNTDCPETYAAVSDIEPRLTLLGPHENALFNITGLKLDASTIPTLQLFNGSWSPFRDCEPLPDLKPSGLRCKGPLGVQFPNTHQVLLQANVYNRPNNLGKFILLGFMNMRSVSPSTVPVGDKAGRPQFLIRTSNAGDIMFYKSYLYLDLLPTSNCGTEPPRRIPALVVGVDGASFDGLADLPQMQSVQVCTYTLVAVVAPPNQPELRQNTTLTLRTHNLPVLTPNTYSLSLAGGLLHLSGSNLFSTAETGFHPRLLLLYTARDSMEVTVSDCNSTTTSLTCMVPPLTIVGRTVPAVASMGDSVAVTIPQVSVAITEIHSQFCSSDIEPPVSKQARDEMSHPLYLPRLNGTVRVINPVSGTTSSLDLSSNDMCCEAKSYQGTQCGAMLRPQGGYVRVDLDGGALVSQVIVSWRRPCTSQPKLIRVHTVLQGGGLYLTHSRISCQTISGENDLYGVCAISFPFPTSVAVEIHVENDTTSGDNTPQSDQYYWLSHIEVRGLPPNVPVAVMATLVAIDNGSPQFATPMLTANYSSDASDRIFAYAAYFDAGNVPVASMTANITTQLDDQPPVELIFMDDINPPRALRVSLPPNAPVGIHTFRLSIPTQLRPFPSSVAQYSVVLKVQIVPGKPSSVNIAMLDAAGKAAPRLITVPAQERIQLDYSLHLTIRDAGYNDCSGADKESRNAICTWGPNGLLLGQAPIENGHGIIRPLVLVHPPRIQHRIMVTVYSASSQNVLTSAGEDPNFIQVNPGLPNSIVVRSGPRQITLSNQFAFPGPSLMLYDVTDFAVAADKTYNITATYKHPQLGNTYTVKSTWSIGVKELLLPSLPVLDPPPAGIYNVLVKDDNKKLTPAETYAKVASGPTNAFKVYSPDGIYQDLPRWKLGVDWKVRLPELPLVPLDVSLYPTSVPPTGYSEEAGRLIGYVECTTPYKYMGNERVRFSTHMLLRNTVVSRSLRTPMCVGLGVGGYPPVATMTIEWKAGPPRYVLIDCPGNLVAAAKTPLDCTLKMSDVSNLPADVSLWDRSRPPVDFVLNLTALGSDLDQNRRKVLSTSRAHWNGTSEMVSMNQVVLDKPSVGRRVLDVYFVNESARWDPFLEFNDLTVAAYPLIVVVPGPPVRMRVTQAYWSHVTVATGIPVAPLDLLDSADNPTCGAAMPVLTADLEGTSITQAMDIQPDPNPKTGAVCALQTSGKGTVQLQFGTTYQVRLVDNSALKLPVVTVPMTMASCATVHGDGWVPWASAPDGCACAPGSRLDNDGRCRTCVRGTYQPSATLETECRPCPYGTTKDAGARSLDECLCGVNEYLSQEVASNGQHKCVPCPSQFVCDGRHAVVAKGFYPDARNATNAYPCPVTHACQGMGKCAQGYQGVLCSQCASDYGRSGSQCLHCDSLAVDISLLVLGGLVAMAVIVWFIVHYLRPSKVLYNVGMRVERSVWNTPPTLVVKILLNHVQAISVFSSITVNWTQASHQLFTVSDTANFALDAAPLNCVASNPTLDQRFFAYALMPLATVLLALLVRSVQIWAEEGRVNWREAWAMMQHRVMPMARIMVFLVHLLVLRMSTQLLSGCTQFGNDFVLRADTRIHCLEGGFVWTQLGVGLVALLECILLPLYILYQLWQHHNQGRLGSPEVWDGYHFFYDSYRPASFLYDFVILARKSALVAVAILFVKSPMVQLYMGSTIMLVALVVQQWLSPYKYFVLTVLENLSLMVGLATLQTGMLVVHPVNSTADSAAREISGWVVVGLNVLFIVAGVGMILTMVWRRARSIISRSIAKSELRELDSMLTTRMLDDQDATVLAGDSVEGSLDMFATGKRQSHRYGGVGTREGESG